MFDTLMSVPLVGEDTTGYVLSQVAYTLCVSEEGEYMAWLPTDLRVRIPYAKRAAGVLPKPFDNPEYTLGVPEGEDHARAAKRHSAYQALWAELSEVAPVYLPVYRFLRNEEAKQEAMREMPPALKGTLGSVLLTVFGGDDLYTRADLKSFWLGRFEVKSDRPLRQCMICLTPDCVTPITHESDLISAGRPAFQSHGWEGSENIPVCISCIQGYNSRWKALKEMRSPFYLARQVSLNVQNRFWGFDTENSEITDYAGDLVVYLSRLYKKGSRVAVPDGTRFRGMIWQTNQARQIFHHIYDEDMTDVVNNVVRWFDVMYGGQSQPDKVHTIFNLCASLVPQGGGDIAALKKRIQPSDEEFLMATALQGRPLPVSLLQRALERHARDPKATRVYDHPTALQALLRLALSYPIHGVTPMTVPHGLDDQNLNPYYLAGRIFACAERMQYLAVGEVNTGIVEKFYSRFSRAPILTAFDILALYKKHLQTARKKNPNLGFVIALDKTVNGLTAKIGADSLHRQRPTPYDLALAHLGYQHQKHRFFHPLKDTAQAEVESPVAADQNA